MDSVQLLVVAYPEISAKDFDWLLAARDQHEALQHSILPPHFTLVFPLTGMDEGELTRHVSEQVTGVSSVSFVLRCAVLLKDDSNDNYYVTLAPDEGFSGIVKLHARLYTGMLGPALRLDIPYIPHITLGYSQDALECKRAVDDLNNPDFKIEGIISCLDLVRKEADEARTIRQFPLEQQNRRVE